MHASRENAENALRDFSRKNEVPRVEINLQTVSIQDKLCFPIVRNERLLLSEELRSNNNNDANSYELFPSSLYSGTSRALVIRRTINDRKRSKILLYTELVINLPIYRFQQGQKLCVHFVNNFL